METPIIIKCKIPFQRDEEKNNKEMVFINSNDDGFLDRPFIKKLINDDQMEILRALYKLKINNFKFGEIKNNSNSRCLYLTIAKNYKIYTDNCEKIFAYYDKIMDEVKNDFNNLNFNYKIYDIMI